MRCLLWLLAFLLLASRADAKPNIIFILTDDHETDLTQHMPTVQRELVRAGSSFIRSFFNNPLCCPSRATMLTGRYGQNTKVSENSHAQFYNTGNPDRTFAVWLKAAGYRNGLVGKYLNEYPKPRTISYIPPGWDYWFARHTGTYYNYAVSDNGVRVVYGSSPADYSTDVYRAKSVEFIKKAMGDGVPYFLWFGVAAPHSPHTPAPRHANAFSDLVVQHDPSFNEDVSDKPAHLVRRGPFSSTYIAGLDATYRDRARTLLAVDEAIAEMIKTVRAAGQLDNTYFVLASDNGWHLGHHRVSRNKGLPYTEGTRMVLHIRGPNVPAGVTNEALLSNADLAPTFAALAGATSPTDLDGRSFMELLHNPTSSMPWRTVVPVMHHESGDVWPTYTGFISKDRMYVEYPATSESEYYDLAEDPYQLTNRSAALPRTKRAAYKSRTNRLATCSGATCRSAEDAALPAR